MPQQTLTKISVNRTEGQRYHFSSCSHNIKKGVKRVHEKFEYGCYFLF